ncbi:MAG: hypothetical protein IJ870_01605 [Alphaproteobacteria bacterium]|nr:hypothetical protein [Alphaproteobacteria bacterium]
MKKLTFLMIIVLVFCLCVPVCQSYAGSYGRKLSQDERNAICERIKGNASIKSAASDGLGGGVIPDDVLVSIYDTTRQISNSVMLVSILGDTLMCHAVRGGKNSAQIGSVRLFSYPNIPVWLTGAVIYFFGFMMLLSICFYVVDISFKLGFAIILMPIGIALWPFDKTKDKLSILISIFLKSAAIFPFLAIMVAYTLGMLSESLGGLKDIFEAITTNNTDYVSETFSLGAPTFLLIVTSLIFGFKLIGSAIDDYANKFFPDKAFGGASPMHHLATQALDFAKQKVIQPVASLAHDIAKTQAGKVTEKAGNLLQGKYHSDIKEGLSSGIRNIGRAVRNPKEMGEKIGIKAAHTVTSAFGGLSKAANNLKYGAGIAAANLAAGKENRDALKERFRNSRDSKNQHIDTTIQSAYDKAMAPVNDAIAQNEALYQQQKDNARADKEAERQRKHNEKMATDPRYRAMAANLQKVKSGVQSAGQWAQNVDQNRKASIGVMTDKIARIDKQKEDALIKTNSFEKGVNKVADTFANGGKLTNWYRNKITGNLDKATNAIQKWQQKQKENIDTGKLASNRNDGLFKAGIKHIRRDIRKLGVNAVSTIAKATPQLLSTVLKAPTALRKGLVNTVAGATKLGASAVVGVPNAFIRGYYNIQKVPTKIQKAVWKAPDALKDTWKIPGVILEKTGQTMQNNKPLAENIENKEVELESWEKQ